MADSVNPGHFTAAALTEYVVENPPAGIVPKIVRDPESVCFGISGLDSVGPWLCEIREIQHSEPACGRNLFPEPSGTVNSAMAPPRIANAWEMGLRRRSKVESCLSKEGLVIGRGRKLRQV